MSECKFVERTSSCLIKKGKFAILRDEPDGASNAK